ncbi:MAG: branched-chain amino acid aminotransferase [Campylobacteraceae bacterium 4484_166]|nr:MAG: branched-chain amino acid aminotransferase [Campylobacteraceae bacterium 4484_166]
MRRYFETIKCEDFKIFNLRYHKDRVASTIGLNLNLEDYIYPPNKKLLKCKLVYDQSGVLSVDFTAYKKQNIKSFKLIYDDMIEYDKKYENRENIKKLFLQKGDNDEIIIVKNNLISDTSKANIAIKYKNGWITPKKPLLKGTKRAKMLEKKKITPSDITVDMLTNCQEFALLNAMVGFYKIKGYEFER